MGSDEKFLLKGVSLLGRSFPRFACSDPVHLCVHRDYPKEAVNVDKQISYRLIEQILAYLSRVDLENYLNFEKRKTNFQFKISLI